MFAEFIYRPISGEYQEIHFGDTASDCAWVKFTTSTAEEWVGSFQRGWIANSRFIKLLGKHERAFIVVDGSAYLIDVATHQLVNNIEITDVRTAIVDEEQLKVYYSNGYDLRSIDMNGDKACLLFEYNEFEEIELLRINDDKLYATYHHYQSGNNKYELVIDLITNEIEDSFPNVNQLHSTEITPQVSNAKPWWRFW